MADLSTSKKASVPLPLIDGSYGAYFDGGTVNRRGNGLPWRQPCTTEAIAETLDLVAGHRPDLHSLMLQVFRASDVAGENTEKLTQLVEDCGVGEIANPYRTALGIAQDLEKLATTTNRWAHPTQVLVRPDSQALFRLCSARVEREGEQAEALREILPRLERAARLAQKAALRRSESPRGAQRQT